MPQGSPPLPESRPLPIVMTSSANDCARASLRVAATHHHELKRFIPSRRWKCTRAAHRGQWIGRECLPAHAVSAAAPGGRSIALPEAAAFPGPAQGSETPRQVIVVRVSVPSAGLAAGRGGVDATSRRVWRPGPGDCLLRPGRSSPSFVPLRSAAGQSTGRPSGRSARSVGRVHRRRRPAFTLPTGDRRSRPARRMDPRRSLDPSTAHPAPPDP